MGPRPGKLLRGRLLGVGIRGTQPLHKFEKRCPDKSAGAFAGHPQNLCRAQTAPLYGVCVPRLLHKKAAPWCGLLMEKDSAKENRQGCLSHSIRAGAIKSAKRVALPVPRPTKKTPTQQFLRTKPQKYKSPPLRKGEGCVKGGPSAGPPFAFD